MTIVAEMLSGLEHAHVNQIIHRDLKPDNVLISNRGEVKITDFGLATLKDLPTVTQEGMVVGTPSFMAPEQAEGSEITPATDVFACGLILFEMLTGHRVHEGTTMAETFQNVMKYQPPHFEEYAEAIPPLVEPVLRRMLERNTAKRFASAGEARESLVASQPEGLLPGTLIADFLLGEPIHRMTARSVVPHKHFSLWLRTGSAAIFVLVIAWLIYYFAVIHNTAVPSKPTPQIEPESLIVAKPVTQPVDTTVHVVPGTTEPTPVAAKPHTLEPQSPLVSNVPIKRPEMPPATGPGLLSISCVPWAQVYIADTLVGTTPLPAPIKLPSGSYDLVLLNPEIGQPVVRPVTVKPGETSDLKVNLYDYVARIRVASVKPWADVYINGKLELRTPSSKTIFRPLGRYVVTLRNPDFPEHSDTLTFREGDPVHEIRVDLSQKSHQ